MAIHAVLVFTMQLGNLLVAEVQLQMNKQKDRKDVEIVR